MPNPKATFVNFIDLSPEDTLVVNKCPQCNGIFGVDWTYWDTLTVDAICPMCGTHIEVMGNEFNIRVHDAEDWQSNYNWR